MGRCSNVVRWSQAPLSFRHPVSPGRRRRSAAGIPTFAMKPANRRHPRAIAAAALLWCGPALRSADSPPTPAPDELPAGTKVERVEIGRLDAKIARTSRARISRDFSVLAYRETADGGERVVVAGVPGPVYAKIYSLDFAPAGHRYGYEVAAADGQKAVVIDGERGPWLAAAEDIIWSADGRHYAYRVRRAEGDAWAVVRDGVVGEFQPGRIGKVALSPTGAHLAVAREDENGKTRLAFYDGKRIAEKTTRLWSSPFKWSRDGSTFALLTEEAKGADAERVLFINGEERARGSNIDADYLVLSDDGRHFAVNLSLPGGKSFLLHDGQRHGPYKDLWGKPTLSANGAQVAFIATLDDDFAHAVVNGKPGPAASTRHGIKSLKLSDDGRVAAYLRQTADKQWAIHHGERILPDAGEVIQLWLSPDGAHAAWVVRTPAGVKMVIDGSTTEPVFRDISRDDAVFSPDSRDFLYVATRDRATFTVRVAGKGGRTYEIAAPLFQFGAPGTFTFVAYEKGAFYRETWSLRR
jgi:hypothetical protein